jgi:exoribonuclease R
MEENEKTSPEPELEAKEIPEGTNEQKQELSLEELAKAYNMTPSQVIKSYGEAQKKITQQGQELSSTRKKYQWADQFAHEINTRKGLREHIESFFEDPASTPSEVKRATDPVFHEVNELKAYVYSLEMNSKVDNLARQYPMDATVRDRIFEEVARTGNPDVEAIYFKIMGPEFFSRSRGEEARGAAKEKNKDAYVQNRGSAHGGKTADVKSMPKSEWSDALDDEIARAFRTTD